MNKTCKMGGALFQEKILLRKTVDYQERCLLRIIIYSLKNGLLRKVQLVHRRKVFFLERPGFFERTRRLYGPCLLGRVKVSSQ